MARASFALRDRRAEDRLDRLDRLARMPLLRTLRTADLRTLAPHLSEATATAGSVVLAGGTKVGHLYIVTAGTVAMDDPDWGVELFGPGAVPLLRELVAGDASPAALVALTDIEVVTLGYQAFVAACQTIESFALGLLRRALV